MKNINSLREAKQKNPYACDIHEDEHNSGIRHAKFYYAEEDPITIQNIHPGLFEGVYYMEWEKSTDPQKYGKLYPVAQTPFEALCIDVDVILDIEFKLLNEHELTAIVYTTYGEFQKIVNYSSAQPSNKTCIKKHILELGDYLQKRIRRGYVSRNHPLYVKYIDTYIDLTASGNN